MGCTQTKAAQPQAAATAPADAELPTLLKKKRTGIVDVGKGITKGAAGVVHGVGAGVASAASTVGHGAASAASTVGHGAVGAVTAVGHGAQQVGSGALGAAKQVGSGAAGIVHRAGTGLMSMTGSDASALQDAPKEQSWFERLCSLDPFACCCQGPTDGNLLGSLVKNILANFDSSTLGVKIEVGDLQLDPASGRVEVAGLTVHNPEGYHSEYLLHADRVVVDIDMQKLLYSFGKEVDIEEMVFDGVDVIYEKSLTTSNLQDLLKKLSDSEESQEAGQAQTQKEDIKVVLHTVLAQNIGAKLATCLTRGHGLRLEVGNLSYQDFDKEMGAGRGMMDIIKTLIKTLIKSVLATVLGKENTKAISGAARGAKEGFKSAASGSTEVLKVGCSKIFSRKGTSTSEFSSSLGPTQSKDVLEV